MILVLVLVHVARAPSVTGISGAHICFPHLFADAMAMLVLLVPISDAACSHGFLFRHWADCCTRRFFSFALLLRTRCRAERAAAKQFSELLAGSAAVPLGPNGRVLRSFAQSSELPLSAQDGSKTAQE
eukprot:6394365-Pyramimonas_sp.AAC.1